MRSRDRWLIAALCCALGSLWACTDRCIRHSDCAAGQSCQRGACVTPDMDRETDLAPPDLLPLDLLPPPDLAPAPDLMAPADLALSPADLTARD